MGSALQGVVPAGNTSPVVTQCFCSLYPAVQRARCSGHLGVFLAPLSWFDGSGQLMEIMGGSKPLPGPLLPTASWSLGGADMEERCLRLGVGVFAAE